MTDNTTESGSPSTESKKAEYASKISAFIKTKKAESGYVEPAKEPTTIRELWEAFADANGKSAEYAAAHATEFPPSYSFKYPWSKTHVTPLVIDADLEPAVAEENFAQMTFNNFANRAKEMLPRIKSTALAAHKELTKFLLTLGKSGPVPSLFERFEYLSGVVRNAEKEISAAKESKQVLEGENASKLLELSKQYYQVMYGGKAQVYDVRKDIWTDFHELISHHSNMEVDVIDPKTEKLTKQNIFNIYRKSEFVPRYGEVVFNPRKDGHYHDSSSPDGAFNLWQGLSIQAEEGDDDMMVWDLLNRICDGNEEYFTYVQKWFAHMIQKPWELPGVALGISGPQGLGKNAFIETFGMLLSTPAAIAAMRNKETFTPIGKVLSTGAYGYFNSYDQIFGNFNAISASKILMFLDEATWGGFHAQKSNTKTAITGATVMINEKHMAQLTVHNYRRFVFASNDVFYYGADKDDRRLLPLEYQAKHKPTAEWFKKFYELRNSGKMLENLAYRLKNIDLTDWNPMKAKNEITIVTGQGIQQESAADFQLWMDDVADTGYITLPADRDNSQREVQACDRFVTEAELKAAYQLHSGKNDSKGWQKPDFTEARNIIFGEKVQRMQGSIRHYGRPMPSQKEMQQRLDAQYKWKRDRWTKSESVVSLVNPTKNVVNF